MVFWVLNSKYKFNIYKLKYICGNINIFNLSCRYLSFFFYCEKKKTFLPKVTCWKQVWLMVYSPWKSGQEFKAGPGAENGRRMLLTGLLWACFLIPPRTTCKGVTLPTVGSACSDLSLIKCSTNMSWEIWFDKGNSSIVFPFCQ